MKYRAIVRPEAENDLKKVFSWYEGKRQGLGHDFLLQVDAGLRFIERNPEICPSDYKGVRKYFGIRVLTPKDFLRTIGEL